jgi:alkylhydroperoxidase family enzyme
MTRVPHREREELPEEFRGLFDSMSQERGYVPNLYRTLAHSPVLLRDFVEMTADIRSRTALDPRLRELAILAVARVTGAAIQWLSHIPVALAAGVPQEQITGLPVWERHPSFDDHERAVIRFAEAVTRDVRPAEDAWQAVRAFLSDREMVELTLVVGYYNMVARFLETVQVDVDPEYLAALQTSSMPT